MKNKKYSVYALSKLDPSLPENQLAKDAGGLVRRISCLQDVTASFLKKLQGLYEDDADVSFFDDPGSSAGFDMLDNIDEFILLFESFHVTEIAALIRLRRFLIEKADAVVKQRTDLCRNIRSAVLPSCKRTRINNFVK